MKKILLGFIIIFSLLFSYQSYIYAVEKNSTLIYAGSDGSSFAGGLAGGMIGGLVTGAMTKDSGGSRRAEDEARRAREKTESLREEFYRSKSDYKTNLMFFILIILFIAVIGLGIMVFVKKHKK